MASIEIKNFSNKFTRLLFFSFSLSLGGRAGAGARLESFQGLEGKSRGKSDRSDVLEGVDDQVGSGNLVGFSDGKGDSSDLVGGVGELGDDVSRVHVEDLRGKDGTVVVDSVDFHTVGEGLNIQFLQEDCFGVSDFLASSTDLEFLGDFNLTLVNLGGHVQGVEERDLRGIHTGGAGVNRDVDGGNHSDLGSSWLLVVFDDGSDFEDGGIGEDEADLSLE